MKRRALITGAGRGIGCAIALAFAQKGIDVAVSARNKNSLEQLQKKCQSFGIKCYAYPCDLSIANVIDPFLKSVENEFGTIDILVNNAGMGSANNPRPVYDFDDNYWDSTLYLNLTVPYLICKKVLPGMLKRKYGRIINIASLAGKTGLVHGAAYCASKHGLLGLTRTLALELAKDSITVNAICPGPVKTITNDQRIAYDARRLGKTVEEIESTVNLIGRRLVPEEIAKMAVYLASDDASAITGQAFNIDGGLLMI